MSTRKAVITQADLKRIMCAAESALVPVARYEVRPDGTVVIITTRDEAAAELTGWEDVR